MLSEQIGHLHLIDSDGTLHDDETSTHTAFGEGYINFSEVLAALKPVIGGLPWWCVDFCFNPETEAKGKNAVSFVKDLMESVL
jgi:sugar phosphate isomerase/epimerase